ncbi:MAG: methyltransferase domain-containing protein [Algicola sp.]|nr:methyltransferase domain-containing protein [Algicola sp.]
MKHLKNNKLLNIFKKKTFNTEDFCYEYYWETHKPGFEHPRHREIVKYIEDSSTVLDLACGDGALMSVIKKHRPKTNVCGVDFSDAAIAFCAKQGFKVEKDNLDDEQFAVENKYDHIVVSEALEHIINPEQLLDKLKDKYTKNLIVTIPNIGYFMHRLSLLLGTFPVQWIRHPAEHIRFWTLSDFKHTLATVGYDNYKFYSIKGVGFLQYIWPSMFSAQTLIVLERNADD